MKAATDVLRDIWAQVLYDRENGYEHRKPKSKGASAKKPVTGGNTTHQKSNCVINVMKLQDDNEADTNAVSTTTVESIPKKRKTHDKTEPPALYVDIGSDAV
jgi:hypothetical protein